MYANEKFSTVDILQEFHGTFFVKYNNFAIIIKYISCSHILVSVVVRAITLLIIS